MKTRTTRAPLFVAIVAVAAFFSVAVPQAQAQSQAADIAFLRAKAENTDSTLVRIDKTLERMNDQFERIDERFDRLEGIVIRLDERMNALQTQNRYFFGPLLLLLLTAMFALLTKGHYWGVDRAPKASGARSGHPAQAAASPA